MSFQSLIRPWLTCRDFQWWKSDAWSPFTWISCHVSFVIHHRYQFLNKLNAIDVEPWMAGERIGRLKRPWIQAANGEAVEILNGKSRDWDWTNHGRGMIGVCRNKRPLIDREFVDKCYEFQWNVPAKKDRPYIDVAGNDVGDAVDVPWIGRCRFRSWSTATTNHRISSINRTDQLWFVQVDHIETNWKSQTTSNNIQQHWNEPPIQRPSNSINIRTVNNPTKSKQPKVGLDNSL